MNEIISKLKYGQCNVEYCPKNNLEKKDKIIINNILNKIKIKQSYDWYKNELKLIQSFQLLLNEYPNYDYKSIVGSKTHLQLSKIEDSKYDTFNYYLKYLNKKYKINIDFKNIKNIYYSLRNIILTLKDQLNMPRPYQLLIYYPEIKLNVEFSTTAITASAPSGHCFYGLINGYLIYLSERKFFDNNYNELITLINISLDFGYHRNMGAIHFIYDNYVSYITFLDVINVYKLNDNNEYLSLIKEPLDKLFKIYNVK
jgi:hypothetical protein